MILILSVMVARALGCSRVWLKVTVLTRLSDKIPGPTTRGASGQKVSRSGKTPRDGETRCAGMFEAFVGRSLHDPSAAQKIALT